MGLFGDWAKTARDVKVALHTNTTHRFNFRCHLLNQFFVPIPFFWGKRVSPAFTGFMAKFLMGYRRPAAYQMERNTVFLRGNSCLY